MTATVVRTTSDELKGSKRKVVVYMLSCKKCNDHGEYVGATSEGLQKTMERHIDRVVAEAKGKAKAADPSGSEGKADERWSADFARHFAGHCKPRTRFRRSMSEREIVEFFRENVKVELLRSKHGTELCWDCDDEFTDVHRSLLARRGSRVSSRKAKAQEVRESAV